jgi:hypothetical protein
MKQFLKRILLLGLRKKKRYKVKSDVYVKLQNAVHKSQIDEISLGGLSFYYTDNGYPVGRSSRHLSLLAGCCDLVDRIPFKIVSDTSVGESMHLKCRIKRMSLKFDGLNFQQKRLLKNVIQHHTIETF